MPEYKLYPTREFLEHAGKKVVGEGGNVSIAFLKQPEFYRAGGTDASILLAVPGDYYEAGDPVPLSENLTIEDSIFSSATKTFEVDISADGRRQVGKTTKVPESIIKSAKTIAFFRDNESGSKSIIGLISRGVAGMPPISLREMAEDIFLLNDTTTDWYVAVGNGAEISLIEEGDGDIIYWDGGSNCLGAIGAGTGGQLLSSVSSTVEFMPRDADTLESAEYNTIPDFPILMAETAQDASLSDWDFSALKFDNEATANDAIATYYEPWVNIQIEQSAILDFPAGFEYDQVYLYISNSDGDMVAFVAQLDAPTDEQPGKVWIEFSADDLLII